MHPCLCCGVFDPGLIVHALLANLPHKARTSVDNIPSSNLFFMATSVGERFAAPRWLSDVDDEFLAYEDQSPGQRLRESCSELIIPSMDRTDGFFEPRYSMKDLLRFFIRGQIFFVQSTVDPLFHLCSPFRHLAAGDMIEVREALRRIIDQLVRRPFLPFLYIFLKAEKPLVDCDSRLASVFCAYARCAGHPYSYRRTPRTRREL